MQLDKGGNAAIPAGTITAAISFGDRPGGIDIDVSAYLLTATRKVRGDADMVFYNQPSHDSGAVTLDVMRSEIRFDPSRIPEEIERVAVCVVVDGGRASSLRTITLSTQSGPEFKHDVSKATEAAIIVGEYYRRNGQWKMRAVGQGFDGGLAPLARSFGMDILDGGATPVPSSPVNVPPAQPSPPPINLSKIDLRKHKVGVSLAKHGITGEKAEILFVIDASGSMVDLYANGTVQETVERIVPVALRLDDDGKMDTWFYADGCRQVEPLDERSMIGFIKRVMPTPGHAPKSKGGLFARREAGVSIGYGNNEPVVMEAILGREPPRRATPLLVIFLTDGGIYQSEQIKAILRKCANRPIFWQYVGVGKANYGVLRELDTIPDRVVDNAGFFSVDDLSKISDEDLYDRLLSEFPQWLREVRAKRILT